MRAGISTGTCAAAAAKAAALVLRDASAAPTAAGCSAVVPPESVEITLPGGAVVAIAVRDAAVLSGSSARASVVKDAGEDVDVTDGAVVWARLESGGSGIGFAAGEGVGTVTRPGLQLAPGEPAINPVPREMISEAVRGVLGDDVDVLVTVGVEGGRGLAERTFNPRLGIEGGISIIGTTGRVEPKSTEAWMRSLVPQVDMARAAGHTTVWLAPGGIGERYAIETLGAPADAVVQCSNFVGDLLDACAERGVERVVLVGHAGKLVKVAAGLFDTHSGAGDARLETVCAVAAAEGASGPLVARLLEAPTVQAAIEALERAGLARVWDAIAERAGVRACARAGLPVDVVLLGYGGELLGATKNAVADGTPAEDRSTGSLTVVGVGPGGDDLVTPLAWSAIRAATVVAGGARLLDAFAPADARRIGIGADVPAALAAVGEAVDAGERVVVLGSGDPGLFGILAAVRRELPHMQAGVVPGVSSMQLALARLGESWDGVVFASAHGRDAEEALETCCAHTRTLVLTDRTATPQAFSAMLEGRGEFRVTVCERLGMDGERVTRDSAGRIAEQEFDPLAVLFIERLGDDA